jgi:signal transduction histidine kinase
MQLHGGHIRVHSTPGVGSVFHLRFDNSIGKVK